MKKYIVLLSLALIFTIFMTGCQEKAEEVRLPEQEQEQEQEPPQPTPSEKPVEENIASFQTTMLDMNKSRVKNIKLAIDKISGRKIEPGETMSFNAWVGPRTAEKGYEKAPIIVHKQKDYAIGGGVCQLATTIYNAALKADLEIVERHEHSTDVPYIEDGSDACVNYDNLDLKIRNSKDGPIKFMISVNEDKINVKVVTAE